MDLVKQENSVKSERSPSQMFPCLSAFEATVQAHPEVLGALYSGSLGRGTFDRYSDLDIDLWVPDTWLEDGPSRLREVMGWLGEVQFLYGGTGFVGPDWQRVDLDLPAPADLKPDPHYAGARVLKDTEGVLARIVAESQPEVVTATLAQARSRLEGSIDSQIYLALHNARGAVWSAMGEISGQGISLYAFLAELRGRRSYGLRYVETLLAPEEEALMTAAWPAAPEREEVRRAARALWDWTRYVWAEAERVLEARLEITLDEAALLAAVDRIYGWE
jgi:hypothetical protein